MKIAIVGGGIQGLTAAWALHKEHEITLFERKDRLGGWIETIDKKGFLFERGPRGFRPHPATLRLCEEIGLKPISANTSAKKRYLLLEGKLCKVSPWMLLPYAPQLIREIRCAPKEGDESIGTFFERRMGRKFTETFIDPLVTGILGGNLWELSLTANFPKLKEWEQIHGSIVRGYMASKKSDSTLLSFEGGMGKLVSALTDKLQGKIQIHLSREMSDVKGFDRIIYAHATEAIPHLTMTTVNMGWHSLKLSLEAFGYLIPSKEKEQILGVTFDSAIFPSSNTRLCVMIRGEPVNAPEIAREALERHLGIKAPPDVVDVHVARNAIPQHLVGQVFTGNRVGINEAIAAAYQMSVAVGSANPSSGKLAQRILAKL